MKKLALLVLVVAFSFGAVVGMSTSSAQAGPCYWRCICSFAYRCCTTPTGTSCKLDPKAPINCPQVAC
jgi:hypothetical protein